MLLYKYRSLENIEFVLDIIKNDRLYCSSYSELNDPFEGVFNSVFDALSYTLPWTIPLTAKLEKFEEIQSIKGNLEVKHAKVCSLSKSLEDVRLWAYYADSHKGIVIEVDLPEKDLFEVTYSPELAEFGDALEAKPSSTDVLSFKTDHWAFEDEFRIIQQDSYYSVAGNIKSIYAGVRLSDFHREILKNLLLPKGIPIIDTEVNPKTISVQRK